ncbi:very short patch repair endonuclease [Caballeronia cordobensis]|uniref:very short patch repair endonuclease n=1 Tax=Caballeronia cordobensis TaxID=1353886 RepID=UPI000A0677DD
MDRLTVDGRSALMKRVKRANTAPEMKVRQIVFKMGFRYRIHDKQLPGRPDLVFKGRRAVILVHGCFWHGHSCARGKRPLSNVAFWDWKLDRNRERDQRVTTELRASGWRVMVIWECETENVERLQVVLREFLDPV